MLDKFLKEVVVIVVGKQAEPIADLLDSKKYVNEFIIAKKLDLTINQTRNILYKLSDNALVSFIRKKDKRKGWYTYFWKIESVRTLEFLRNFLKKNIDQIEHQIKSRETKQFYICERCNIEFNEENALIHDFTCSECGGVFTLKDNTKDLKELRRSLDKLNKKLDLVNGEIRKEEEKIEKQKIKVAKKEEEIKKALRKKQAMEQARLKKKLEKPKKKIIKKVKKPKKIKKVIKKRRKKFRKKTKKRKR